MGGYIINLKQEAILNMLHDTEGATEGMARRSERCEPDYESMIEGISKRLAKTTAFKDAALEYFDGKRARGKMAELVGELVTEARQLAQEKYIIIEQQEASKSK